MPVIGYHVCRVKHQGTHPSQETGTQVIAHIANNHAQYLAIGDRSGNTNRVVSIVGHNLDDLVSATFASSSIIHRMYSAVRMGRLVDGS
jgi:hypothetical protein